MIISVLSVYVISCSLLSAIGRTLSQHLVLIMTPRSCIHCISGIGTLLQS